MRLDEFGDKAILGGPIGPVTPVSSPWDLSMSSDGLVHNADLVHLSWIAYVI